MAKDRDLDLKDCYAGINESLFVAKSYVDRLMAHAIEIGSGLGLGLLILILKYRKCMIYANNSHIESAAMVFSIILVQLRCTET